MLVPLSRLDATVNRLAEDGFDEGPEPSKEFSVSEGTGMELSFHGNIRRDDEQQSTRFVFHFLEDVESHFRLSPVDRFLQRQLSAYRGVVDVYRLTQHSKNQVDSRSNCIRTLVASHHINVPKEVGFSAAKQCLLKVVTPPRCSSVIVLSVGHSFVLSSVSRIIHQRVRSVVLSVSRITHERVRSVVLSVSMIIHQRVRSVVLSVGRITHEGVYGCQPNMVGMDKARPSRRD